MFTKQEILAKYRTETESFFANAPKRLRTKSRTEEVQKFADAAEAGDLIVDGGSVWIPSYNERFRTWTVIPYADSWQIDPAELEKHNEAVHELRHATEHYRVISDRAGIRLEINSVEMLLPSAGIAGDGDHVCFIQNRAERADLSLVRHDPLGGYDRFMANFAKVKTLRIFASDCDGGFENEAVCEKTFDQPVEVDVYAVSNGWKLVI